MIFIIRREGSRCEPSKIIKVNKYLQMENPILSKESYFDRMELEDARLLKAFNEQIKWFDGLTASTKGNPIDFKATDKKGRLVHIELKKRKGTIEDYSEQGKFGAIFVEPTKLAFFTRIGESGHTLNERRLFVNFVDDGVIIFPLDEMKGTRLIWYPNHRHQNYGKNNIEYEDRIGLPLESAIVFKKDENGEYKQVYPIARKYTELLSEAQMKMMGKHTDCF